MPPVLVTEYPVPVLLSGSPLHSDSDWAISSVLLWVCPQLGGWVSKPERLGRPVSDLIHQVVGTPIIGPEEIAQSLSEWSGLPESSTGTGLFSDQTGGMHPTEGQGWPSCMGCEEHASYHI